MTSAKSRALEKLRALKRELEQDWREKKVQEPSSSDAARTEELKRISAEKVAKFLRERGEF